MPYTPEQLRQAQQMIDQTHNALDPTREQSVSSFYRDNPGTAPAAPEGLSIRSVRTVAIDPRTGLPAGQAPQQRSAAERGAPNYRSPAPVYQPSGSMIADKSQDRLTPNVFGYGTNGASGGNAATSAIASMFRDVPMPRNRPNIGQLATAGQAPETGMFGHTMSPGMEAALANDPSFNSPAGATIPKAPPLNITVPGNGPSGVADMYAPTPAPAPKRVASTNGYVYEVSPGSKPVRVGSTRSAGTTPSQQYDQAAAKARASSPDNGGNPSWW